MAGESQFRRTGVTIRQERSEQPDFIALDPREQLVSLLREHVQERAFSELSAVTFDHRAAGIIGHTLLDTLEEQGFSVEDYDAVGALTAAAVPLVDAMIHAAASRGEDLDGFVMDFVYPSIKGPSIAGKRVVLIDAWLSEKSFIQTSSLVVLQEGNTLALDCSVVRNEQAEICAIAALVGAGQDTRQEVSIRDTVSDETYQVPFIRVFAEEQLRA